MGVAHTNALMWDKYLVNSLLAGGIVYFYVLIVPAFDITWAPSLISGTRKFEIPVHEHTGVMIGQPMNAYSDVSRIKTWQTFTATLAVFQIEFKRNYFKSETGTLFRLRF